MSGSDFAVLYGAAFLLPLVAALLVTPFAARAAERLGVMDHPGERKAHVAPTPYLGGLAIAAGLVVAGLLVGSTTYEVLAIVGGALAVFVLGLLDDLRGLSPWIRLAVEAALGVVLWFASVRAGVFNVAVLDLALTVAWVVVITNAVNLSDNMDGLASGVTAIASFAYFAISVAQADYLVASFAAALAGMSLGFLRHNFPPARIFLGDAGSLTLGFLLAALGLKLDLPVADVWVRVTVAFLILGVPVFDTALVVVSRRRAGRPVMVGGTDHTSHRLAGLGLSSREVALGIYALQFACCTVAVAMINAPSAASVILLVEIAIAISALVALIASAKRRGPADPGTPAPSA